MLHQIDEAPLQVWRQMALPAHTEIEEEEASQHHLGVLSLKGSLMALAFPNALSVRVSLLPTYC